MKRLRRDESTNVALGFISVPPDCHCAALNQTHKPLEVALIDDAAIVCASLRVIRVKFLAGEISP